MSINVTICDSTGLCNSLWTHLCANPGQAHSQQCQWWTHFVIYAVNRALQQSVVTSLSDTLHLQPPLFSPSHSSAAAMRTACFQIVKSLKKLSWTSGGLCILQLTEKAQCLKTTFCWISEKPDKLPVWWLFSSRCLFLMSYCCCFKNVGDNADKKLFTGWVHSHKPSWFVISDKWASIHFKFKLIGLYVIKTDVEIYRKAW